MPRFNNEVKRLNGTASELWEDYVANCHAARAKDAIDSERFMLAAEAESLMEKMIELAATGSVQAREYLDQWGDKDEEIRLAIWGVWKP